MAAKILVVDDSMMVRRQVSQALVQAGFSVIEATDGADALAKIGDGVALVVCDVNMPNMSGLDFLTALRESPTLAATNVVMLTTEGQNDLIQKAKALGAKGWIMKPFKADLLVAAARKLTAAA
jgi:two-component system chemotaxis response regulator CheY